MTIEEIKKEAERFFEWPSDNKLTVTTTSAILFADFIARKERETVKLNAEGNAK